ncbi:MAG: hypothetical protein OEM01_03170 [Desulfobulbaceae bacterium]|nr:hypothetical protein [Desulfobulbaceae bacterium]
MKSIILVTVSLFILAGCGAMEPSVISTEKNTFSSTKKPSIQIELPTVFEYLGNIDDPLLLESSRGIEFPSLQTERNFYFYGQISDDNYLQKLITINVLELPFGSYWNPETIRITNPLKREDVKLGPKKFQCCIHSTETTGSLTGQFLLDKGITTPRCYMRMLFGNVFGENVKMYISYYEDASRFKEFDIDSCQDWDEKEALNDKQKEFLEGFEKRALNSIRIL